MLEFQQKNKIKKIVYSRTVLILLFLLVLLLSNAAYSVYKKEKLTQKNLDVAMRDFDKLQIRQDTLSAQVTKLSTDQGIEEEIRKKYRVVKEGEGIAVIVDELQPKVIPEPEVERGFWKRICYTILP